MNNKVLIFRWKQLLVITAAHLIIDMFAGMLPTILPAIQTQFALTVAQGALILGTLNFTCNLVQVLTGHLRPGKNKPLFMHLGFLLAAAICLIGFLPRSADSMPAILTLAIVTAVGVAILHPEGMRAIHVLRQISASMTTSVFMAGGFVGISTGMLIAPILVTKFGLEGLYFLLICPAVGMALIYFLRIKLAVERPRSIQKAGEKATLSFWPVMLMAVPTTTATTIISWIIPMRLHELGFELTFGGVCSMVFCVGGAIGSFFWSKAADKKGPLFCSIIALLLGIPLLICHQAMIENKFAVLFLFFAGFGSIAAYPLIATVARYTTGPNLGMRMSLIVGGAWGIASVIQMVAGYFAEEIGLHNILLYSPAGYLMSAITGFFIFKRIGNTAEDFSGIMLVNKNDKNNNNTNRALTTMINYDAHIHTAYCGHAEGMTTEAIIREAELKKLKTIIITDHVFNSDDLKIIDKIREEAAAVETDCNVIVGAEVDADGLRSDGKLVTDELDNINYVIGSIHYIPGVGNYPNSPEDCSLEPEELLERWQSSLLGIVSNPKVNTLAHPGRMVASILEFDPFFEDMLAIFAQAAKISAENNVFWEINELNGNKLSDEYKRSWYKIYETALDEGVGLVFGSDAHKIENIGKTTFTQKVLRRLPANCLLNPNDMGIVND